MRRAGFNSRLEGRWAKPTLLPLTLSEEEEEGGLAFPKLSVPAKPRLPANRLRLKYPPAETICHVSHQINS